MKKCVFYTALSCLALTIFGLTVAFFGYRLDLFVEAILHVVGLFPALWWVILPPAVGLLVLIINIAVKAKKKNKCAIVPFALFVSILAYLLVVPRLAVKLPTIMREIIQLNGELSLQRDQADNQKRPR